MRYSVFMASFVLTLTLNGCMDIPSHYPYGPHQPVHSRVHWLSSAIVEFFIDHKHLPNVGNNCLQATPRLFDILTGDIIACNCSSEKLRNNAYLPYVSERDRVDVWGESYWIALDKDNDGLVRMPDGKMIKATTIMVWSSGANRINEYGFGDDINSWEHWDDMKKRLGPYRAKRTLPAP